MLWLWLEYLWPLSSAWVGTGLAVRLSAVWSSSAGLAFVVGSQAEMHRRILCLTGLVAHSVAVQLHLQQSRNGHSVLGCTTGLVHQPSVLGD